MGKNIGHDEFLSRVRSLHGDRFKYPDIYVRGHDTLRIECLIHGYFNQVAREHMAGATCPQCARIQRPKTKMYSQEKFFSKCRSKHNNKYSYPEPFSGVHNQLCVECPTHGRYYQLANNHMRGSGCQKCKGDLLSRINTQDHDHFIKRAREAHGSKYTDPQIYTTMKDAITIECPEHGLFEQVADYHVNGYGCQKCGGFYTLTLADFEERAKKIHGDKFTYPGPLNGMNRYTTIVCPVHGKFQQTPNNHLRGRGCKNCTSHYSRGHQEVEALLSSLGVKLLSSTRKVIKPLELDIYVPDISLAIEFNGDFWHSLDRDGRTRKNKHRDKFYHCRDKGIKLLQITENEWNSDRTRPIWESIIRIHTKHPHRKVQARKCKFRIIPRKMAQGFLNFNHLQGSTPRILFSYGLFMAEELVGVITFALHNKKQLILSRMAFLRNTIVVGGANKLFKNALRFLPPLDVLTFSNNMYSAGDVYPRLGFEEAGILPVSYQWYRGTSLLEKRKCRHKYLPKILGVKYDPKLSEHDNMFRAGWRCLYDAGYQRWLYRRDPTTEPINQVALSPDSFRYPGIAT